MNISKELLEKAKTAKTAEELAEMAKAEGVETTAEQAEKAFENLHKSGELADEELDNVSGGCGNPSPMGEVKSADQVVFLYDVGQRVEVHGLVEVWYATITKRYVHQIGDSYFPYYTVEYIDNKETANVGQEALRD